MMNESGGLEKDLSAQREMAKNQPHHGATPHTGKWPFAVLKRTVLIEYLTCL
jgi:hypothetical protein